MCSAYTSFARILLVVPPSSWRICQKYKHTWSALLVPQNASSGHKSTHKSIHWIYMDRCMGLKDLGNNKVKMLDSIWIVDGWNPWTDGKFSDFCLPTFRTPEINAFWWWVCNLSWTNFFLKKKKYVRWIHINNTSHHIKSNQMELTEINEQNALLNTGSSISNIESTKTHTVHTFHNSEKLSKNQLWEQKHTVCKRPKISKAVIAIKSHLHETNNHMVKPTKSTTMKRTKEKSATQ